MQSFFILQNIYLQFFLSNRHRSLFEGVNPLLDRKGASGAPIMVFSGYIFVLPAKTFSLLSIPRQYKPAHIDENRFQISFGVTEVEFFSRDVNFRKPRMFMTTAIHCLILSLPICYIRRISASGTHRSEIPTATPYFQGSGSQRYYCGYYPMKPEVGISKWRPLNRKYI